jgi:hypothetical protein
MTAICRAMVCCNVLVINTPIGRQAAHDDRYMQRAANEGIAALQRQQQVVVIALHRRFMSLGGGELSSAGCHNLRYSKWGRHAGLW